MLYLFIIINIMEKENTQILISVTKIVSDLGINIKLARLRRRLSTAQISERAGINRVTLWQIEKGSPKVSIGSYAQVLFVLGMEKDLLNIAKDDTLGRKLQDAKILEKKRAPRI